MAKSAVLENLETGRTERQCRYFKTKVLGNHQADVTNQTFEHAVAYEK